MEKPLSGIKKGGINMKRSECSTAPTLGRLFWRGLDLCEAAAMPEVMQPTRDALAKSVTASDGLQAPCFASTWTHEQVDEPALLRPPTSSTIKASCTADDDVSTKPIYKIPFQLRTFFDSMRGSQNSSLGSTFCGASLSSVTPAISAQAARECPTPSSCWSLPDLRSQDR
eukprot:2386011-Pleurochrysis_carterae.AAC.2